MFVICLMGLKCSKLHEAAIVNRLSTETKWDLGITSLINVSCAERRFRLGLYNVMVFVR